MNFCSTLYLCKTLLSRTHTSIIELSVSLSLCASVLNLPWRLSLRLCGSIVFVLSLATCRLQLPKLSIQRIQPSHPPNPIVGGGITGAIRRNSANSAPNSLMPADQNSQFSGCTGAVRLPFQRTNVQIVQKLRILRTFCISRRLLQKKPNPLCP